MEDKSQRPKMSTLPVDALFKIAMVFQWVIAQGKYKADDWRKGVSWRENYDSLQRHLMDYYKGIDFDKDICRAPACICMWLYLFHGEYLMVEVLLQLLVGQVDTELLKTVHLKIFKSKDIENS